MSSKQVLGRVANGVGTLSLAAMLLLAGSARAQQDQPQQGQPQQTLDLSTSKQMLLPVPGGAQRVNSQPMTLAVSPDGRWVVSLNAGYGTYESRYAQSLAVLDTQTGAVKDYPEARLGPRAGQSYFAGLAFSADGQTLYASVGSSTDPDGKHAERGRSTGAPTRKDTGNGVIVYHFADGAPTPTSLIALPVVKLAAGRRTEYPRAPSPTEAIPYPAAIAVLGNGHLLVAENLADAVAEVDPVAGKVVRSWDVSESSAVPGTYPNALAVTRDGRRAFVALWNASEVDELDLSAPGAVGRVVRRVELLKPHAATAPGSHPYALLLDEKSETLYAALANRDAVAAIRVGSERAPQLLVKGYFDTRLPGQTFFGAEPDALAMNADGTRLYVADMALDAVAVIDPRRVRSLEKARGMVEPLGFVPTELMPLALASAGGKLYVASDKGRGTGPNNMPQRQVVGEEGGRRGSFTYAPTLLYGSLATLDEGSLHGTLKAATQDVLESNRMRAAQPKLPFADGKSPIRHVIYIIKENRTYDQILGDLSADGHKVGNGDPSLTMYGAGVTPNEHRLALQFGVLDNFYDSAEVSGDGHVWSNAAIGTPYLEDTWQANYRGGQRTYDYEGMVADGYPLLQHIPDVEEPASSYIWTDMVQHGRSVYHFGEYISSTFCDERKTKAGTANPQQGAMSGTEQACAQPFIEPGAAMPAAWGGGKNLWPWPIPRLLNNVATKPELVGHFAPQYPDFNLRVPDQVRVDVFLRQLAKWEADLKAGHDTMPNMIQLRLPNDHTAGTVPGGPTPEASAADNDLAVGRAVDAISHSPFWKSTAFFILEDDAQNGGDHVDAHRSVGLVISAYAPHPKAREAAVVDSRFYSTVSFIRTMEALLGVPPMNNNDAFASMPVDLFTGPGDQPPYVADDANAKNGLIYTANKRNAVGADASMKMDFTHADRADSRTLNLILWREAKGDVPPPSMLLQKPKKEKDDDDD